VEQPKVWTVPLDRPENPPPRVAAAVPPVAQREMHLGGEHRETVLAQLRDLTRCLDLINYKVGVYEDILVEATGTDTYQNVST
jgi:hypothetical protein